MSRPLREIAQSLRDLAGEGDLENAHWQADKLLLEALERVAGYATETVDEGEVESVIEAWRAVGKWYA